MGNYVHPSDDRYGPRVAGFRYKKFIPPEPLAVTILKYVAVGLVVASSPALLIKGIHVYLKLKRDKRDYFEYIDKKRVQASLRYLKRKQFIAFPAKDRLTITADGGKRLSRIKLDKLTIKKVPWDGKWRLLTFDIPQDKEGKRDYFRRRLKEIGFYHFQRSVFIFPYPCNDEIALMTNELGVEVNVHILLTDRFEGDKKLLLFFHLANKSSHD